MKSEYLRISGIPVILWGEPSEMLFIFVHGENSSKEEAEEFAGIVGGYGIQTLSFDLPGSGERGKESINSSRRSLISASVFFRFICSFEMMAFVDCV